jgi:hypothetical protein
MAPMMACAGNDDKMGAVMAGGRTTEIEIGVMWCAVF